MSSEEHETEQSGVQSLRYVFVSNREGVDYLAAKPWVGQVSDFDVRLADGRLVAKPTKRFDSAEAARRELEPYLRAWEFKAEVIDGEPITFRFEKAVVCEPRSTGSSALTVTGAISMRGAVLIEAKKDHYPEPPSHALADTPLAQEVRGYVRDVRGKRQRLLAAAYLLLTRLEYEYGGRANAARTLRVSRRVLDTLARLASTNDPNERRKVGGPAVDLKDEERAWILAAMSQLAFHVAASEAGVTLPKLTMADLPAL